MSETTRAFRKTRVGIVISDKMDKTIVVAIATNSIRCIIRSSREPTSSRPMTKRTKPASAIPSRSWSAVRCPRTRDGDL